jgi:uncharacterized protein (DUF1015 family)
VPYDVVNTAEARQLAQGNEWSLLHVSRPEIDLPDSVDIYDPRVYQQGWDNFQQLQQRGAFIVDNAPALYIYRLKMGEHTQVGVVGCCAVDEYDQDIVRKHEKTRKDKEDDRTRHTVTLRAQTEPVFLTYRGQDALDALVAAEMDKPPLYDFVAADGIGHTIWAVTAVDSLSAAFQTVDLLYVADGHHRSASASRARAALQAENPAHNGQEEYNFFLAVMFPAAQLQILPYNRVVLDLNGRTTSEFLTAVAEHFQVTATTNPVPSKGQFGMYLAGTWYALTPREAVDPTNVIAALDVSVLQDRLLAPLLGIDDPRTSKRVDFVGGIRGTAELERLVNSGKAAVAFSLYATTVDDLIRIADAGQIMPPKSTWFEPKLRSGMLIHQI